MYNESSVNGMRLIYSTVNQQMITGRTPLPHTRNLRLPDWKTFMAKTHINWSEISHKLTGCPKVRGANADTDHYVLLAGLRC
jgi:hypothetical protein